MAALLTLWGKKIHNLSSFKWKDIKIEMNQVFFSIIINDLFVKDSNASLQKKIVETKKQRYAK